MIEKIKSLENQIKELDLKRIELIKELEYCKIEYHKQLLKAERLEKAKLQRELIKLDVLISKCSKYQPLRLEKLQNKKKELLNKIKN